ncbi:MAG: helix-turn-helix domain-containing protein [Candidatus Edwardsbacteria bacterium]
MKTELEREDIEAIAQRVVELLRPILSGNSNQEDDTLFDVEGLSKYLKVNKQWVYDKVHQGAIPYYKVGKYPRFRKSEINGWFKQEARKGTRGIIKTMNTVRKLLEPTS